MNTITIETKCGQVTGCSYADGNIFSGIPYATAERFEYPVPVTDFGGCFDATKKPIECPQMSEFTDDSDHFYTKEFRKGQTYDYAESPITLNIITPRETGNCPVLVYVHGGSFLHGKQSELPAGTSMEYARRGIILVSVAYRLNVFALYRSNNFFLYDLVCALNWVKDNISDYGGNSSDITLIGQSAGAMSVFQLLYTDVLKGVIRRAILMSGAGFFPRFGNGYTREQGKPFWDKVMNAAGCSNDEDLKKVPAETLWKAWAETREKHGTIHLMQPGVDGKIIPCQPSEIKKHGKMLDIPLLIGVTSQDMLVPLKMFTMAKQFAQWRCRTASSSVYTYYFNHIPPGDDHYRAFHSSDLWYVFGNMDKSWRGFTEEDYRLKDEMADSVARFVKEGNPGWDAFSLKERKFRKFDRPGKNEIEYVKLWNCLPELIRTTFFDRGPF